MLTYYQDGIYCLCLIFTIGLKGSMHCISCRGLINFKALELEKQQFNKEEAQPDDRIL